MRIEHGLYAVSTLGALGIAYWVITLFWTQPDYPEGFAFSEYSTIKHPLFRERDFIRVDEVPADGELITGSIPPPQKVKRGAPSPPTGLHLLGVYDGVAIVGDEKGKVRAVVQDSKLPRLGKVLAIVKNQGRWELITENGLILPRDVEAPPQSSQR